MALMKGKIFSSWSSLKGDVSGGAISGIVSLPGDIAFGMIAFSPLGSEFLHVGVLAGIFSAIFGTIITSLMGRMQIMLPSPTAPMALVWASVMIELQNSNVLPQSLNNPSTYIAMACLVAILSGFMQIIFGLIRIGDLVKFISYPVIAGILNGTVILIFLGQLAPFLGLFGKTAGDVPGNLHLIQWPAIMVSTVTVLVMLQGSKITKKIPSAILAMILGSLTYHLLQWTPWGKAAGPLIVGPSSGLPSPAPMLHLFESVPLLPFANLFSLWISAAFTMAVLGAIDTLLATVYVSELIQKRPSGNRELIAQGVGNILAACFGGLPSAGNIGRSVISFKGGSRTFISGIASALTKFTIIVFLAFMIGVIPQGVMAGIVVSIGYHILDRWGFHLGNKLVQQQITHKGEAIINLTIMFLVMAVTTFFNLITAVIVGVGVSIVYFLFQASRSAVRRVFDADKMMSKKIRSFQVMTALDAEKSKIKIVELEGPLFFGSTDKIASTLEELGAHGGEYFIFDMKRVTRIDTTAAQAIQRYVNILKTQGKDLVFSYLEPGNEEWDVFQDVGLVDIVGKECFFSDTSLAIEFFEDRLLEKMRKDHCLPSEESFELDSFFSFYGMEAEEMGLLKKYFIIREFTTGTAIFQSGDPGDHLFIIQKGSVDVVLPLSENKFKRLVTLAQGAIFGEMGILDRKLRSATVIATSDTSCHVLDREQFTVLQDEHPSIATGLFRIIALILADRLRGSNIMIAELES